jgi:hypothetical protein
MARLQGALALVLSLAALLAASARAQTPVAYNRISAGVFVTCAIAESGLLYCWCAAPPPCRGRSRPAVGQ